MTSTAFSLEIRTFGQTVRLDNLESHHFMTNKWRMGCRIATGFGFNVLFKAILYAPSEANTPLKGIHHCFIDLFIIK